MAGVQDAGPPETVLRRIVFGLTMALFYSAIMSAVFSILANGFQMSTLPLWLRNWAVALLVAMPIGIVLRLLAERIASLLVPRS
jgi:predicted MFS family arabinose efflux permease